MAERYVILGLAQARAGWFRSLAQWTTSGTVPAEFVKNMSLAAAAGFRPRGEASRPSPSSRRSGRLPVGAGLPFSLDVAAA